VTGKRGRRRRKPLDDLKERRGYSHLEEEALDRTMCRAGFGPVVRQTTSANECHLLVHNTVGSCSRHGVVAARLTPTCMARQHCTSFKNI
jgi:hypothetical protein